MINRRWFAIQPLRFKRPNFIFAATLLRTIVVTIPNIITLMRAVLVPVIVWALLAGAWFPAFLLFLLAGLSDAVDGAIARTFDQHSELGTILDPLADKVMLVSVFVVLGYLGQIPIWLTILVVSRDVLIVVGIVLCFMIEKPVTIRPLWVSKANTVAQIVLAGLVLGVRALDLSLPEVTLSMVWLTGALTAASALAYVIQGARHLATENTVPPRKA